MCVCLCLSNTAGARKMCVAGESHFPRGPLPKLMNGSLATRDMLIDLAVKIWHRLITKNDPLEPSMDVLTKAFQLYYAEQVSTVCSGWVCLTRNVW